MENLQPKLRFPEFKDSYNLLKLKDLTLRIGDGLHSTPKYNDLGNYHFINGNNLKDGLIVIDEKTKKVDEEEYLKHKRDIDNNTILLSINGTIGNLAYYNNENVILGKSACYINVFENKLSKKYLYYQLKTNRIIKYFENSLTGSTIKNLGLKSVSNTTIITPSIQEQTKIADFLGAVDKQLDILNQKKEKLNTYKKGVMQQLFAQQLRFKDDNGNDFPDWEKKTLGEISKIFSGKSKKSEIDEGFNLYGSTGIIGLTDEPNHNGKSILVARVGANAGFLYKVDGKYGVSDNTLIITDLKDNFDFVYYLLIISNLNKFIFGSGQPLITGSILKKLIVSIPSLEEQTKIADFLSAIDKQIEAVENQITKTETYKKGLLQQMFV